MAYPPLHYSILPMLVSYDESGAERSGTEWELRPGLMNGITVQVGWATLSLLTYKFYFYFTRTLSI